MKERTTGNQKYVRRKERPTKRNRDKASDRIRVVSAVRMTLTCECGFHVTVSTSVLLFSPAAVSSVWWVATCSPGLFRLHDTGVVRSVKPPLTSMCSNDEENVCVFPVSISTLISGARENLGVGCFEVVHFQELHSSLRLPCTLVSCLSEYTVTER